MKCHMKEIKHPMRNGTWTRSPRWRGCRQVAEGRMTVPGWIQSQAGMNVWRERPGSGGFVGWKSGRAVGARTKVVTVDGDGQRGRSAPPWGKERRVYSVGDRVPLETSGWTGAVTDHPCDSPEALFWWQCRHAGRAGVWLQYTWPFSRLSLRAHRPPGPSPGAGVSTRWFVNGVLSLRASACHSTASIRLGGPFKTEWLSVKSLFVSCFTWNDIMTYCETG